MHGSKSPNNRTGYAVWIVVVNCNAGAASAELHDGAARADGGSIGAAAAGRRCAQACIG